LQSLLIEAISGTLPVHPEAAAEMQLLFKKLQFVHVPQNYRSDLSIKGRVFS
jgi:hypothetical protein